MERADDEARREGAREGVERTTGAAGQGGGEDVIWFVGEEALPVRLGGLVVHGVCLDDPDVAPVHAVIERRGDGQLWLVDLHKNYSRTQLNGAWIDSAPLRRGDWVELGASALEVVEADAEALGLAVRWTPAREDEALAWGDEAAEALEVSVVWRGHLVAVRAFDGAAGQGRVTLGATPGCDVVVECARERVELACWDGARWRLTLAPEWDGELCEGGLWWPVAALEGREGVEPSLSVEDGLELPLDDPRAQVRLRFGEVELIVRAGPRLPRYAGPGGVDPAPVPYLSVSAALHWAFLTLALLIPPGVSAALELEAYAPISQDRLVAISLPPQPSPPAQQGHELMGDGREQALSAKGGGEEGKAGAPDALIEELRRVAVASDMPELTRVGLRRSDAEHARGILQTLDAISSLRGSAERQTGEALRQAEGQLRDAARGDSRGAGGLGLADAGRGAGAHAGESLGLSVVHAHALPRLGGSGAAREALLERPERPLDMMLQRGEPSRDGAEARGCLSASMIRTAIQLRRAQIRACYEQELQVTPNLRGRLDVVLEIAPDGHVRAISTPRNTFPRRSTVPACVTARLSTLRFPAFSRCDVVTARHPFHFAPAPALAPALKK